MKRFLLFLSLWLTTGWASAQSRASLSPALEGERTEYAVTLQLKEVHLSGICIMKRMETEIVGSWLNEFGIRAFDFRYTLSNHRIELSNLLETLDRWYIRRVLRRDLSLLLTYGDQPPSDPIRGRRIEHPSPELWLLHNERHHITYRFSRLTK